MRIFIAPVSGPCRVLYEEGIPFWTHVLDARLHGVPR